MQVFLGIMLIFISITLKGYVLTRLWLWFIVPTFNLPIISTFCAIGINLILILTVHQVNWSDLDRNNSGIQGLWETFLAGIVIPLITWSIAYIITIFA